MIAGTTALAAAGFGIPAAFADPRVLTTRVHLPRLAPKASGCRIALVSDLHLGSLRGRAFTQQVVDMVNATRPDLVHASSRTPPRPGSTSNCRATPTAGSSRRSPCW